MPVRILFHVILKPFGMCVEKEDDVNLFILMTTQMLESKDFEDVIKLLPKNLQYLWSSVKKC